MELTKPPFTKSEMIDELRGTLVNLSLTLGAVYGPDNSEKMLSAGLLNGQDEARPLKQLDMSVFPITTDMEKLYDFAFHGIARNIDWDVVEVDYYAFFAGLEKFYPLDIGHSNELPQATHRCLHTIDLAAARAELTGDDQGGSLLNFSTVLTSGVHAPAGMLPLRHMALLAGLDEKTIRNLAGPKSKQPLTTVSFAKRTYVEIGVAREWLRARGALVELAYVDKKPDRDLAQTGFSSLDDMFNFLNERFDCIEEPSNTDSLLAENRKRMADFHTTYAGWSIEFLIEIAHLLKLDPALFGEAAVKLFRSVQLQQLHLKLSTQSTADSNMVALMNGDDPSAT